MGLRAEDCIAKVTHPMYTHTYLHMCVDYIEAICLSNFCFVVHRACVGLSGASLLWMEAWGALYQVPQTLCLTTGRSGANEKKSGMQLELLHMHLSKHFPLPGAACVEVMRMLNRARP